MFQTFSGSSRRPRQVNLSGQNTNPFAANSWTPAASGTRQTVANAQQERLQRQQERERLNATKRIQRIWRGHKVRRELADLRRHAWDRAGSSRGGSGSEAVLAEQLRLLMAFFSSRRHDDMRRLEYLSQEIVSLDYDLFLDRQDIQPQITRLAKATLEALHVSLPECQDILLRLLIAIIDRRPDIFPRISRSYYSYLSHLFVENTSRKLDKALILAAIRVPLTEHTVTGQEDKPVLDAYTSFASQFLTTPDLGSRLGGLNEIAPLVNVSLLSNALIREYSNSPEKAQSSGRLWLLAHFIALHRLQRRSGQEPDFLRALSLQLSSCSGDIVGRIDATNPEVMEDSGDNDSPPSTLLALPTTIKDELLSLVNKASITGLLAKFNIDYVKASAAGEEDASLLASYALTLLRIFPQRGDDIRMWLYQGSMRTTSGVQVPALKFFWQAMSLTSTFSAIRDDSKAALSILRPQTRLSNSLSTSDITRDGEWRTILLFLELYTFALRFTDDEEFLSGGNTTLGQQSDSVSRFRESALPIEDVRRLTLFLKNLAFTTYYNASELSTDGDQVIDGGLGTYFGTNTGSSTFQAQDAAVARRNKPARPFAGIAGMTFDYMRTIVRGVMRMLYERDSRRRFLPKDHWLMTSRFDMEGFIPAVVMEEERQHEVREGGEDGEADEDLDMEPRDDLSLIGMARPRRAQQLEILQRRQQRVARKKVLAAVGPRLEVLQNMPFVIPFETRVQIFRQFVLLDQTRRRGGNVDPDIWRMSMLQNAMVQHGPNHRLGREALGRHHAKIRRDRVFEDAYEQFYDLGDGLKEPIQITFVDKFDSVEAGIDGGGVTKEFLTSVTNEAFRSEDGPNLFVANDQNLLYPNPGALDERRGFMRQAGLTEQSAEWQETISDTLRQYQFLGRIVGKCLYEGILVDIGFAGFFLLKWAASASEGGYRPNINDLRDLDEKLYQGLLKLKNYPGNVEDFSLDFTIEDVISPPGAPTQTITRELMPNGSKTPVTNENRPLYVFYVALHRLKTQPLQQTQAFLHGLCEIIKPSWLSMFNQSELQTLIGGDSSEIDVEDLRANTQYGGIYQIGDDGLEHPTIQLFWRVMKELDNSDRRKVLKYVTSTPRAPLLGFSALNPRFSIRDAGSDEERLPSTSTCVNLLKLPKYTTASVLRSKLLYAVNSGAGFDLS